MPNITDEDRLSAKTRDSKIVNLDEYRALSSINRAPVSPYTDPRVAMAGALGLFALLLLILAFAARR